MVCMISHRRTRQETWTGLGWLVLGLYAGPSLPRHADFPSVLAKIAAALQRAYLVSTACISCFALRAPKASKSAVRIPVKMGWIPHCHFLSPHPHLRFPHRSLFHDHTLFSILSYRLRNHHLFSSLIISLFTPYTSHCMTHPRP